MKNKQLLFYCLFVLSIVKSVLWIKGPALDGIFQTFGFREFRKCSAVKIGNFLEKTGIFKLAKFSWIFTAPAALKKQRLLEKWSELTLK